MAPPPEQHSPSSPPVGPMTPRRLRDVPALAWLMAREFARPGRDAEPNLWLAVGMLPAFVVASMDAGVYHWDLLAVLTVHRTGLRLVLHRFAVVCGLVVALSVVGLLADALGVSWYLAGFGVAVLAYLGYALWASSRAAVKHAEKRKALEPPAEVPTARVDGPEGPRATWDISMGAATPGMDAIHTLYGPLVRDLVPSGCTVDLIARNPYLADEYELEGFLFRPGSKRKMYLTLP